jgi:hypothetical protein
MLARIVVILVLLNFCVASKNESCYFHKLIKRMNSLTSDTRDVVIMKPPGEDQNSLADDILDRILDCIPDENPVLIILDQEQFLSDGNSFRLRQPSFTFLITDTSEMVGILICLVDYLFDDPMILQDNIKPVLNDTLIALYTYWNINSNFVILPTNPVEFEDVPKIARTLLDMEILNFIIHLDDSLSYSHNIFSNQTYRVQTADPEDAFPDKLKDLHGYSYRLFVYPQLQTFLQNDEGFHGPWIDFVDIMSKQQNATYHVAEIILPGHLNLEKLIFDLVSKRYDFCVNLDISFKGFSADLGIDTFSTDSYSALIPNEPRRSFLSFILTPFDLATWILMIICLILGALLYFFSTRTVSFTSIGSFFYSIYGLFLGQGSALFAACSLKNFYFQVFVVFAFLLGTVYQSLIISFIALHRDVYSIQSLEDLKNSDLLIYTDPYFKYLMSSEDDEFKQKLTIFNIPNVTFLTSSDDKMAMVAACKKVETWHKIFNNVSDSFYKLRTPMISFYLKSVTRKSNPFARRIQEYILKVFESGILQYFQRKFGVVLNKHLKTIRDVPDFPDDDDPDVELLKFEDLLGIFNILLVGFGFATLVFSLEWSHFLIKKWLKARNAHK